MERSDGKQISNCPYAWLHYLRRKRIQKNTMTYQYLYFTANWNFHSFSDACSAWSINQSTLETLYADFPAASWFLLTNQPKCYSHLESSKNANDHDLFFYQSPIYKTRYLVIFILHRCHFATFKQCQEWVKRLNRAIAHPARLEDLFALAYHAWCLGGNADDEDQHVHLCRPGY